MLYSPSFQLNQLRRVVAHSISQLLCQLQYQCPCSQLNQYMRQASRIVLQRNELKMVHSWNCQIAQSSW
uniref:Uncharacterized protein n=1 Tax=Arundo donax TaxID=35708 RepID=A0A0A9E2K2_ARUDO